MHRLLAIAMVAVLGACAGPPSSETSFRVAATNPRFGDTDPFDWTGIKPWRYAVHGIDVAKYQGEIDWRRAKAAGVAFAFIKATEGGDRLDERFRQNWAAARRAGVPRGAYHFYYFCRPAIEQARWFIDHAPREKGALPPVLDAEWNHKSPTCKLRPDPKVVRREFSVFLKRLSRHYGQKPIIYTTVDFYTDNELWRLKGHEFWLRSVAGHPSKVYPNQDWTFWQYTGTGVVPGIDGNTDINAFSGSRAEWRDWIAERAL